MKKNIFLVALALIATTSAFAEKNTVSSPDGKLNVVVEDHDGKLYYAIDYAGKRMMDESQLGLVANVGDLASENVYFTEHHAKKEGFELTMHPFCRNAVASMDWGGTMMNKYMSEDNKSRHRRYTTDVFEMASAIVNQAAIQCIAIYPNNLTELPQHEIDFLKAVPTTWDETQFVDGYPGKYAVVARRHGDKWYVAGLNGTDQVKKLTLSLPMLAGKTVTYYYETANKDKKALWPVSLVKTAKVDKKGNVKVEMQPQGGLVIVNN